MDELEPVEVEPLTAMVFSAFLAYIEAPGVYIGVTQLMLILVQFTIDGYVIMLVCIEMVAM